MNPARACRERAARWAASEERVVAAVVYGSVAAGTEGQFSDLDLLVVARDGQRSQLWDARDAIAGAILGADLGWAQEVAWQRPYRYQAWDASFGSMVDLTFDEGRPLVWRGLAEGHEFLVDREGVADWLTAELRGWAPPEFEAGSFDAGTWPWLAYLDNHLRRGNYWMVRTGLYDTLNTRVVPLLGASTDSAEHRLDPDDVVSLHRAAPSSGDPSELRRALVATALLYEAGLDRWAARTGSARPVHPMARAVLERIQI